MASSGMKSFYKQQKKKPASKPSGGSGATVGSRHPPQPAALISHGSPDLIDDYGEEEAKLRGFDMDMRFGPCIGMTRLERWERAEALGLHPPSDVGRILLSARSDKGSVSLDCLWEGKI